AAEVGLHDGTTDRRSPGLAPDTLHALDGHTVRTLPRPPGELLARFCTVNDVHFGEVECGVLNGTAAPPIYTSAPGEDPYPEVMVRAAVADMLVVEPDAVLVKGDLTCMG